MKQGPELLLHGVGAETVAYGEYAEDSVIGGHITGINLFIETRITIVMLKIYIVANI